MRRPDQRSLFDWQWYAKRHRLEGEDAAWRHYSTEGVRLGLDPNPLFDSRWYYANHPEAVRAGAVRHFLSAKIAKALRPSPLFESDWYLDTHPDVRSAGLNPFVHYMQWGRHEERLPNRWCDPDYRGSAIFEPVLRADFVLEDLIGYIPHYTTLSRLLSGAEASAFLSPGTPRWIFAKLAEPGGEIDAGQETALLGGRRELFNGANAYAPDGGGASHGRYRAFQVRYAISPIIRNAIAALGLDLSSQGQMDAFRDAIQKVAATQPDMPVSHMNVMVDADFAREVRGYFAKGPLSALNIIALEQGYLCRASRPMRLMQ